MPNNNAKLKIKLWNLEGDSMQTSGPAFDQNAREEFAYLVLLGLAGYGFKKEDEDYNQFFARVLKAFNKRRMGTMHTLKTEGPTHDT